MKNQDRFKLKHIVNHRGVKMPAIFVSLRAFWDVVVRAKAHPAGTRFNMAIPVPFRDLVRFQAYDVGSLDLSPESVAEAWVWETSVKDGEVRYTRTYIEPFGFGRTDRVVLLVEGSPDLALEVEFESYEVFGLPCGTLNETAHWLVRFRVKGPLPGPAPDFAESLAPVDSSLLAPGAAPHPPLGEPE